MRLPLALQPNHLDDALPEIGRETLRHLAASEPDLIVAAVEALPVCVTIANMSRPDMPLAYVNAAFTETTGYGVADAIGRNCRFLQGPDTDRQAVQALREAIVCKSPVSVEFINYRKDGTPFINALKMAPVHDDMGRLISFIGIQNDVTEERARTTSEISRQRMEALGQMAGGVAHQLNNLLQPIVTLVSLHRPEIADPHLARDFDTVLESARQAASVVADVLAFSRRGDKELSVEPMLKTVRKNVHFIRTLLPVSVLVRLMVGQGADALHARLDPHQFCQALANLMINASQAMQGRGEIRVGVERHGSDRVKVWVEDEGPGIPPELRARVMEPFFSTRTGDGGTGLGLPVVSGIINALGGTTDIDDSQCPGADCGCRVTLSLPVAR